MASVCCCVCCRVENFALLSNPSGLLPSGRKTPIAQTDSSDFCSAGKASGLKERHTPLPKKPAKSRVVVVMGLEDKREHHNHTNVFHNQCCWNYSVKVIQLLINDGSFKSNLITSLPTLFYQ